MNTMQEYRRRLLAELIRLAPGHGRQSPDSTATNPSAAPEAGSFPPEAIQALQFSRPPKPGMGDLALAVFPVAKALLRKPAEVASEWAAAVRAEVEADGALVRELPIPVRSVSTAGPYLNLTLDAAAQADLVLRTVAERASRYGEEVRSGISTMVEYSSPNTNKPLHLGHIRNNILGMSLTNILDAAGEEVIPVNLINDRGIHICKSMLAYRLWGEGDTPASKGEKGDHFVGRHYVRFNTELVAERLDFARSSSVDPARFSAEAIRSAADRDEARRLEEEAERFEADFLRASGLMRQAQEYLRRWEAGDGEILALWRTMNDWVFEGFEQTYSRLGCRFARWYRESETWTEGRAEVERGLAEGVFYRLEDGSVWAKLEPFGLQDKILLRADGTSVYITQDIGTAMAKFRDYGMDRSLYVVGSEQVAHFRNLFAILEALGHSWARNCHHASYGLVTLPRGMGRLKSREGTAVDADDLLDELHTMALARIEEGGYCDNPEDRQRTAEQIGQGALKMYLLQVSAEKNIQFDPNETISFTGDTGPAVQYSHARICGILRKGLAAGRVSEMDLLHPGDTAADECRGERPAPGSRSDPDATSAHPAGGPFMRPELVDAALLSAPEEREVLRQLGDFPDAITLAARQLSPAPVAAALLDLTKAYARMYHEHPVLKAGTRELMAARLQLSLAVAQVLRNGLRLLTIEAPERM